jgi:hypothetical protein
MSFTHMGSITATANIPIVVDLQNVFCTLSHPSSAEVTINARTIGDVTCRQNGITNFHHYYVDPPSAAPGTPSFQIKRGVATQVNVDLESDPGFGPFQNVWEDVGVGAFWGFVYSGTGTGTAWASFTVSIRQGIGTTDNEVLYPTLDTASWFLSATLT